MMAAFMVNVVRNPVISIIYLILVFLFSVLLLIHIGVEFIAVVIFIVYVGAISILFLFVVMMLNIRVLDAYSLMMYYVPIGAFLGLLFFFEWMYLVYKDKWILDFYIDLEALAFNKAIFFNNTNLIGQLLFNNYYHLFIIISFILLVSMIGAINLTSEFRLHIKRAKINVLNIEKKVIFWKT